MKNYRRVAYIARVRGLKGEVELHSTGDLPFCVAAGAPLWLVPPNAGGVRQTAVREQRGPATRPWVYLTGVETRAAALPLVGHYLLALAADCPDQSAGDQPNPGAAAPEPLYTQVGMIGAAVYECQAGYIGRIVDIDRSNPQPLWVVACGGEPTPTGPGEDAANATAVGRPGGLPFLIPAVDAYIVDCNAEKLTLALPAGLLGLNR